MSIPLNLLAQYPNPWYIETGIWRGDSIRQAIDAGFKNIAGIDIDPSCIEFCKSRFRLVNRWPRDQPVRKLVAGDSAEVLGNLLHDITTPFTILLDGHWQFMEGTDPGKNPFPLLRELEQIKTHPFAARSTIIIDDWHIFYPDRVGYGKEDIIHSLKTINPNFKLSWVANPVIDGVLVATP